ncbi:hypothetical protein DAPPUDRAFT_256206 [Daphnia pulex]|uniref:C-type lectin domain-containing protein n=1 Tax=Daphnia pulex TaxID=6669 RepID=E9HB06_DAPPU|nr:hypothetical protein DAPPUDRAFT_256206 [Daphnia pulex]|eukprot:EFX71126.1 hypothetical protein DAPPUDRAFT_256206 [Daphnia pulex]
MSNVACEGSMGPANTCLKVKKVCYCYVKTQLSWAKANDYCNTYDMKLLSIKTQSVQNDVSDILMPLVLGYPISKQIGVWTSGAYNTGQKGFAWLEPFTFVNWFYGEPNTGISNPCVRIVPESMSDAKWATLPCDQWLPFICEKN